MILRLILHGSGACGASRAECHIMQVGLMGAGSSDPVPGVRVLGLRASTSLVLVPAEPGVIGETDGVRMYMHTKVWIKSYESALVKPSIGIVTAFAKV